MGNTYILEVERMTKKDWETVKQMKPDNLLYLIPNDQGNVPYTIFNDLKEITAPYEFRTVEELGIIRHNTYATLFTLGMQYKNASGLLVIKISDTGLEEINELTVQTLSGELKFCIIGEKQESSKPLNPEPGISTNPSPETEVSQNETISETYDESELKDTEGSLEVPLSLLSKFQALDPSGLLSRYAPSVYKVIKDNEGEPLMALSFAMQEEIQNEADSEAIIDIITKEGVLSSLLATI